jgi:hypothetical protein
MEFGARNTKVRERIITAEVMKLERRQASERAAALHEASSHGSREAVAGHGEPHTDENGLGPANPAA